MSQDRRDRVSKGRVRGSGEAIRPPWWLIPVLPLLVERIRRAADRDAPCITILQTPGIRAEYSRPRADHASPRAPCRPVQPLAGCQPAAPPSATAASNGSRSGSLVRRSRHWGCRILQLSRPIVEASAVFLAERRPGCEALQPRSLTAICRKGKPRVLGVRYREDDLEGPALGIPLDPGRSGLDWPVSSSSPILIFNLLAALRRPWRTPGCVRVADREG